MVQQITFKTFLEAELKPMDAGENTGDLAALANLVKNSKAAKPDGDPYIWRGVRHATQAEVLHPGSGRRTSENTTNFYTILFDANPANKKFPKRSESFICTTDFKVARSYGRAKDDQILAIYPLGDSKVASVNAADIWHVKLKLESLGHVDNLPAINEMLQEIVEGVADKVESYEDIMKAIRSVDPRQVKETALSHDFGGMSSAARNASPEEFVNMLINDLTTSYVYEKIGMEVLPVSEVPAKSEVWFSQKCVVIPMTQLEEFKQLLKE